MAQQRDWVFRSALAGWSLAIGAALLLLTLFFGQSFIPPGSLRLDHLPELPGLQGWDAVVLGLFLLLLALLLYAAARQRAVSNTKLRPSAGCPSCQQYKLIRVSRHRRDRLLGLSLIPMGRFVCAHCRWEGRRVIHKPVSRRDSKSPDVRTVSLNSRETSEIVSFIGQQKKAWNSTAVQDAQTTNMAGAMGLDARDQFAPPAHAGEPAVVNPLTAAAGYQLHDQWSNHVINVIAQDPSDSEAPGEVVGTLHVQIWQRPGEKPRLQAWLDHSTTTVTIYNRTRKVEKTRS